MAHTHTVAIHVLGILGNIASTTFFLTSVPMIIKMLRTKSTYELSGFNVHMLKLMSCSMWVIYALPMLHSHAIWILLSSSLGCAFSLSYLIPFCYYCPHPQRNSVIKKLILVSCGLGATVGIILSLLHTQKSRLKAMGIICGIMSSVMHLGLLSQMREALNFKDTKYLHPHSSIVAFIKGGTWMAYGVLSMDLYIVVPNGVGVLIGCVQMLLAFFLACMQRKSPILKPNQVITGLSIKVEVDVQELEEDTPTNDKIIDVIQVFQIDTSLENLTNLENFSSSRWSLRIGTITSTVPLEYVL